MAAGILVRPWWHDAVKIAFISDMHSNLHALEAVLDHLRSEGVDKIYCLGDIVGYNAFPKECVALVRKASAAVVMGNHDYAAANEDYRNFNSLALAGARFSAANLAKEDVEYLRRLPLMREVHVDGVNVTLCHGSPDDPLWAYVFPNDAQSMLSVVEQGQAEDEPCVLALGHTHVPMLVRTGPQERPAPLVVMNPGSVGQPRDGDERASLAVLDTTTHEVVFHRVAYDVEAAAEAIRKAGLPSALGERLRVGR